MYYYYQICGLHVRFEIPWAVKVTEESKPFLLASGTSVQPDVTVRFSGVDSLSLPDTDGFWNVNSYYLAGDREQRVWHCPLRNETPYCCVVWNADCANVLTCYYVRGQEHQIPYTRNLLEILSLETFLLRFDGLILHASVVDWEGKGILFCAPSGTGKSTQAALWERYKGSRTLNGDRAGIRCEGGIWKAWGLPFAGTSGIYSNESVPIRAIVLLRQGAENVITPVQPIEAFKRMLPECSAQRWEAGFMERLTGVLSALICDMPMYQLSCRPDLEAVELLRDAIMRESGAAAEIPDDST